MEVFIIQGFIMKVILVPVLLVLSDYVFPNLNYGNLTQAVLTGLVIAVIGQLMEVMLLHKGTVFTSTVLDFFVSFLVIYLSQFVLAGTRITLVGAFMAALVIGVVEHVEHIWLVQSGRTEKGQ
ncbi:DUF2512 family protein [Brevibacillus ginsengisoli]|uniref:DUF2512 family protein n=1 Tax=Brevibacillus ginsengisoli TaxID=363854 RepID=UPI003CE8A846